MCEFYQILFISGGNLITRWNFFADCKYLPVSFFADCKFLPVKFLLVTVVAIIVKMSVISREGVTPALTMDTLSLQH